MLGFQKLLKSALNLVFVSYPAAISAEKIIRKNIEKIENSIPEINGNNERLSIALLKNQQNKCLENKNVIEAKAKQNLFGVTLASSIIFASFSLMIGESSQSIFNGIYILIILPVAIGIFYFLLGGIAALQALKIDKWYDLSLQEEIDFNKSISLGFEFKKYIKLNYLTNLIRTNYTTVSQNTIIIGILSLVIFVFLAASLLIFRKVI